MQVSFDEVVQKLPELRQEASRHVLYCSYDGHPEEEFMVDFWRRALNVVFKHYWPHIEISIEELKAIFQHDLRRPFGLEALIQELIARGELIDVQELKALADYKAKTQLSWKGWLFAKVSNLLKERKTFSGVVASSAKLQDVCRKVEDWVKEQSKFNVVRKDDMIKHLATLGFDSSDADLVLVKMYCDNAAVIIQRDLGGHKLELVKVRNNDSLEVTETDQAFILLTATIEQIENKLKEHERIKDKYINEARSWISRKQREKAKRALQRGRLVDTYIDQLHNRRHECESQVLELSTAEANSSVMGSLRLANEAFKLTQVSVEQAQQLKDALEEAHDQQVEVSTILATPIAPEEEDEETLLRELDELCRDHDVEEAKQVELPEVPTGFPIPKVRPFNVESESSVQYA